MHSVDGRLSSPQVGPPSTAQLQAAVQWYLTLNDADVSPEQHLAWKNWLGADPEHVKAWARIEKLQQQLCGVPRDVALPILSQMGVQRRQGLKMLLVLAAGATVLAGYRLSPYHTDFATRTGERRQVTLPDGSCLELNTDTRVDIAYNAQERLILLRRGEILVTTATDRLPARPLSVETPQGRIRALGTRFDVRLLPGLSSVHVQQHAVEVRPRDTPQHIQRVDEGQALTFGSSQLGNLRPATADSSAWTQGLLVAIDWRLGDFVGELARYRVGYLGCADEVRDLRISGAFRLDDIDGILANLQVSLPVKVRHFSRYWARIEA
ncbi:iron dicitrate transport regulator FecR [Pseudomonas sp. ICMP 8385]|uniref:FecR domain-containing protein n=1 Tax=Pseudomonas sp. ICMP 8385 TaxID=1718920 RepID=UPI000C072593|nr:FecR domain-containing protein [Pseudomonas sp. ICMP 8385]PHN61338.1 iron dicitrate transport regulator FecR [Pseudomonas sp. ICMP 8385]